MVLVISVALGVTLAREITQYQLRTHVKLYPEIVRLTVEDDARIYAFFDTAAAGTVDPALDQRFREFLTLGNIFRVKVWGRDATVLWSDQRELIGQRFTDNDGFQDAMK